MNIERALRDLYEPIHPETTPASPPKTKHGGFESLYLEKDSPISHGQAVITGIVLESFIAHAHFDLNDEDLNTILRLISNHYDWIDIPFSGDAILQKLSNDKKNTDQMLFTLPMGIGNVQQNCEVSALQVAQAIELYAKYRS